MGTKNYRLFVKSHQLLVKPYHILDKMTLLLKT